MNICVCCDRGQIYCPDCQELSARKRKQKANKKYKQSVRGRKKKSEQNQRRYKRLKDQEKNTFQGDRGSPLNSNSISSAPAAILLAEGVKNESCIFSGDSEKTKPKISENKKVTVVCAFCDKECAPFVRPSVPWRQVRRMWFRGRFYPAGGSES